MYKYYRSFKFSYIFGGFVSLYGCVYKNHRNQTITKMVRKYYFLGIASTDKFIVYFESMKISFLFKKYSDSNEFHWTERLHPILSLTSVPSQYSI